MKLIFILGPHRTGTKSFAHYFQSYFKQEVHSFHQFGSLRWVNIFSNLFLARLITERFYKWILKKTLIKHIEAHSDKAIYILSNGFNFLAVKYIKEIYSDVKVIHAIRDPRTFVVSYMNFIEGRWKSKLANRMIPFWHLPGYHTDSFTRREWNQLSKLEKYAWYWMFKNKFIDAEYRRDSQNYLLLKLEDIKNIESRMEKLRLLHAFVGLPLGEIRIEFFNKKINSSKANMSNELDHKIISKVVKICTPLMQEYNYQY